MASMKSRSYRLLPPFLSFPFHCAEQQLTWMYCCRGKVTAACIVRASQTRNCLSSLLCKNSIWPGIHRMLVTLSKEKKKERKKKKENNRKENKQRERKINTCSPSPNTCIFTFKKKKKKKANHVAVDVGCANGLSCSQVPELHVRVARAGHHEIICACRAIMSARKYMHKLIRRKYPAAGPAR